MNDETGEYIVIKTTLKGTISGFKSNQEILEIGGGDIEDFESVFKEGIWETFGINVDDKEEMDRLTLKKDSKSEEKIPDLLFNYFEKTGGPKGIKINDMGFTDSLDSWCKGFSEELKAGKKERVKRKLRGEN